MEALGLSCPSYLHLWDRYGGCHVKHFPMLSKESFRGHRSACFWFVYVFPFPPRAPIPRHRRRWGWAAWAIFLASIFLACAKIKGVPRPQRTLKFKLNPNAGTSQTGWSRSASERAGRKSVSRRA